jgi:PAS domain S-box-containing protein
MVRFWRPVYRLDDIVKTVTALASMATAALVWLVPVAVAIPGSDEAAQEIEDRGRAEEQVSQVKAELETKLRERTSQLDSANAQLAEFAAALDKTQAIIQKLDGTILYWNSFAESMYGWSRRQAVGRKSHELLETEFAQPLEEIQSRLLQSGNWTGEFRQRRRDGTLIWVAIDWTLHRNSAGEPVSVAQMNSDVTERRRISEALRISEATARSLFENAAQGILTADRGGRIVDANAMAQRLFGYSRAELIGVRVEMLLPENFRARDDGHRTNYAAQPHARPMGQDRDLVARRKDGSEFPVEISLSYVAEHQTGLAMAFISDITARKQASQEREVLIARLESALAEKTVLLKEVHHRVKNNLAVIAGLLGMQAAAVEDERLTIALEKSQQRVTSMALVHEYLYATEHLNRVNFGKYVHQLANELSVSYAIESDLVSVRIEAEEIDLPVHRAIPCGLILNELLSNALKYAFPDNRSGHITVRFARLDNGELSLSCEDDGVGILESFDWKNAPSLGLKIVRILTTQLDGELTLESSQGVTRFELRFLPSAAFERVTGLPGTES